MFRAKTFRVYFERHQFLGVPSKARAMLEVYFVLLLELLCIVQFIWTTVGRKGQSIEATTVSLHPTRLGIFFHHFSSSSSLFVFDLCFGQYFFCFVLFC